MTTARQHPDPTGQLLATEHPGEQRHRSGQRDGPDHRGDHEAAAHLAGEPEDDDRDDGHAELDEVVPDPAHHDHERVVLGGQPPRLVLLVVHDDGQRAPSGHDVADRRPALVLGEGVAVRDPSRRGGHDPEPVRQQRDRGDDDREGHVAPRHRPDELADLLHVRHARQHAEEHDPEHRERDRDAREEPEHQAATGLELRRGRSAGGGHEPVSLPQGRRRPVGPRRERVGRHRRRRRAAPSGDGSTATSASRARHRSGTRGGT